MSEEHLGLGNPSPLFADKYRFVRPLGKGAMGEVWLAEEEGPLAFRRKVAIKLLHASLESYDDAAQSFIAEAQVIARIDHPNVVRLIELGSTENGIHLVLDFNDGPALNRIIKDAGALSPKVVAYLGREVARALGAVHEMCDETGRPYGVVHRDVSPSNILVSREGQVRLTDFGVARISGVNGERTQAGVIKGKLAYMPPEQARCEPFDGRADIFSLGVTLLEALTGAPLRRTETQSQLIMMVATEPVARVRELRADVPDGLADAIDGATEFSAQRRHRDAAELGQHFDDVLRGFGPRAEQETRRELKELVMAVGAGSPNRLASTWPRSRSARAGSLSISSSRLQRGEPGESGGWRMPSTLPSLGHASGQSGLAFADYHARRTPSALPPELLKTTASAGAPTPLYLRAKVLVWVVALGVLSGVVVAHLATLKRTSTPASTMATAASSSSRAEASVARGGGGVPAADAAAVAVESLPMATAASARSSAPASPPPPPPPERKVAAAGGPANRRAPAGRPTTSGASEAGAAGTLQVVVLPWAEVSVNGRAVGTTPMAPLSLPSGTHSVVLQNPELGVVRSMSVNVEAGKRALVRIDLRRASE